MVILYPELTQELVLSSLTSLARVNDPRRVYWKMVTKAW